MSEGSDETVATRGIGRGQSGWVHRPTAPLRCAGCDELLERVQRLEREVEALRGVIPAGALSPTFGYWLCVSIHSLVVLIALLSEDFVLVGLASACGFAATLIACHVLSTRDFIQKSCRTILAGSCVVSAGVLGLWLNDQGDPIDLLMFLVVSIPPMFVVGWTVAKVLVTASGWRIVPPRCGFARPNMRIQHLLAVTVGIAVYFAIARATVGDDVDWIWDDFAMVLYAVFPIAGCTAVACLIAHSIWSQSIQAMVQAVLLLTGLGMLLNMTAVFFTSLVVSGDVEEVLDALPIFALYAAAMTAGVVISATFTLSVLRASGFRFLGRSGQAIGRPAVAE